MEKHDIGDITEKIVLDFVSNKADEKPKTPEFEKGFSITELYVALGTLLATATLIYFVLSSVTNKL